MKSFEELRLGPEVVAALAAEGIESPTPFQAAAIPVVLRGNDVLGRVGPGGGALVGYAAPLLERLQGNAGAPACLVLCASRRQATRLARSAAPLCEATGHRAAALARPWRRPEEADFLFVPADGLRPLLDGTIGTETVRAVVLHDGDGVAAGVPADRLETLLAGLPDDCQRVFCGLPFGPVLQSMARRFTRRAATIPSPDRQEAAAEGRGARPRRRGQPSGARLLRCVAADGGRFEATLALLASLLRPAADGPAREAAAPSRSSSGLTPLLRQRAPRHVLVFASSADQAADLGDFIEMHGFAVGRPGDEAAPVWLCPGEDEAAREAVEAHRAPESIATVSAAVPAAAETASLRHGAGGAAWVVAQTREMRHVEAVAEKAGFALKRVQAERPPAVSEAIDALGEELSQTARSPETIPYALLVEELGSGLAATEIAAAALALLHRERGAEARDASAPPPPKAWVRLFLSCGERDEIGPREIVGAVTSEAGVSGKEIGKIQVRDKHAIVEVAEPEAARIVKALNGITLGGRSLRVDYDRQREKRPASSGPSAARPRRPASPGGRRTAPRRPHGKLSPGNKSPPGKRTGATRSRKDQKPTAKRRP